MKKMLAMCLSMVLAISVLSACSSKPEQQEQQEDEKQQKLSIVTTIFPQYDFTRQIAGDEADVAMLLKPGAESHSYEPTPQDIKAIENCDLFIYTGGENDAWVERILDSMGEHRPDTLRLVDCVSAVKEEIVEGMEHEHGHNHGEIAEEDIKDRPLADFLGSYQSVLPYFEDGTLDDYISEEAEEHDKNFDEMRKEFMEKKASDYSRVSIRNDMVSLKSSSKEVGAHYDYIGFKTSQNDEGKISGVWYIFRIKAPVEGMPVYLAFNDHRIDSEHRDHDEHKQEMNHIHLRYGNESVDALMKDERWSPTYFPVEASGADIAAFIEEHTHHHEEELDEHVWTSPSNAIKIVAQISAQMCEKDAANAEIYQANAKKYTEQLSELDRSFRQVVESANRRTILFGDRFPFRYFADTYGLDYFAAFTGCSAESEASAATVAFLTEKVKAEKLPVVFTIELSNGKIADSICEATGAKKLTLYSCHNITSDQMKDGATYLSMMTENVESLRTALN